MEFEVSRKDVLLDNDRFSRFMRLAMDAPNTLSHFFSEVRLYLEKKRGKSSLNTIQQASPCTTCHSKSDTGHRATQPLQKFFMPTKKPGEKPKVAAKFTTYSPASE